MTKLFDNERHYQPTDPEIIELLGSPQKQAQMRHHRRSPSYFRLGRKIIYAGKDLNDWAQENRIEHCRLGVFQ